MLRHRTLILFVLGLAAVAPAGVFAQQPQTREQVNAQFAEQYDKLEAQHIAALAKVAEKETGDAASATYQLVFKLAIARNSYPAAEPAAEHVIKTGGYSPEVEMLAHFVNVIAEADRGEYEQSLNDLKEYVKGHQENRARVDADTALAIGEAYFQRLVGAGKFDVAKQLCEFASGSPHAAVKEHFAKRAKRLEMIGKAAPALAGTDADGKKVSLADFKGKVVLVDFWATWCPPCSLQMIKLNTLQAKFKDQGFVVVGVNVDALRSGVDAMDDVLPTVRRYLIDHQASYPNIISQKGDTSMPEAYAVDDIPANFLINAEGKIIGFELSDGNMIRAVEQALKK